jgi:nucleotide-binding universal stress UspA family protein
MTTELLTDGPSEQEVSVDRIVVGVDGSHASMQALRWAGFLARTTGSTIEAVTAWSPPLTWVGAGWAVPPIDWYPEAEAQKLLDSTVAEVLGEEAAASVRLTVREGGAAQVLLDLSRSARLLIVGSRGHGGFAGLLLGSVSSACAEHATVPVLVVHGDTAVPVPR